MFDRERPREKVWFEVVPTVAFPAVATKSRWLPFRGIERLILYRGFNGFCHKSWVSINNIIERT